MIEKLENLFERVLKNRDEMNEIHSFLWKTFCEKSNSGQSDACDFSNDFRTASYIRSSLQDATRVIEYICNFYITESNINDSSAKYEILKEINRFANQSLEEMQRKIEIINNFKNDIKNTNFLLTVKEIKLQYEEFISILEEITE